MTSYNLDIIVKGIDKGASSMLGALDGALKTLAKAGIALAAAATVALGAGLAKAIGAAREFDATMSGVQAVTGVTADQFGALSSAAMRIGKDTSFSAKEAANAIEMLAKNGLSVPDILNGAADAAVNLAAATGLKGEEGLSTAADIATDAMSIFGIKAKDMAVAINGISGVTVNSKFSINDYALALAQGGGVASAAGVDYADFNATIAAISPLFASGSDAGTSYKVMLQNLIPKSKDAAGMMQQLGLMTADGANKFFDANGKMRSGAEIAGLLQHALSGLSDEQKNNALSTIFGTDAMRAAVGLANVGTDGYNALAASIGKVDAATQAATRLDNLAGDVEQFYGSLETAGIQIGQAFTPILRTLTQAATAFINTHLIDQDWTPLISGIQNVIAFITPFVDGLFNADLSAAGLAATLRGLAEQGLTLLENAARRAVDSVVTATPGLVASFGAWGLAALGWIIDALPGMLGWLLELRNQAIGFVLAHAPDLIDSLRVWSLALLDWIVEALPGLLETFARATAELIGLIGYYAPQIITALGAWALALLQWVVDALPGLLRNLGETVGGLLDAIWRAVPGIVAALARWGAKFVQWVIDAAPGLFRELLSLITDVLTWLGARVPGIAAKLGEWVVAFLAWVGPMIPKLLTALGEMASALLLWVGQQAPGLLNKLGEWSSQFGVWAHDTGLPALGNALLAIATGLWASISSRWNAAFAAGSIGESMVNGIRDGFTDEWNKFKEMLNSWLPWLVETFMPGVISGPKLRGIGSGIVKNIAQGISDSWGNFTGWLSGLFGGATPEGISASPPPIPGFARGVRNFSGGMAIVGEQGPELINLPGGADVLPNNVTRGLLGGGGATGGGSTIVINVTVQGSVTSERDLLETIRAGLARTNTRNAYAG